ncbi:hypothetical protein JOM56_014740 [Amanita muscaria]
MAPISVFSRSFHDAPNSTTNGVHRITHTLDQTPFRHLSVWAYFALGIILLIATVVLGYFVFTCYRSAAVDVGSTVEAPAQGDIYTEGRTSPRTGGRRKEMIQAKRRGIVAFSDKAKVFGRQSQDRIKTKEQHQGSAEQKKKQFKSPGLHVTNAVDFSIRSYSSDGDSSCAIDSRSLPTPPRAYFHDSHRESPVKRSVNFSADSPRNLGTAAPATPKTPCRPSKPSKISTPLTTPLTPKTSKARTPAFQRATPTEIKYDSHNIRFVLPREKSMENLENARLWRDPKLSPVGGNIIYPFPTIAPQQHMSPLVGLSQQSSLGKKGACGDASLGHGKTEKAKGRK